MPNNIRDLPVIDPSQGPPQLPPEGTPQEALAGLKPGVQPEQNIGELERGFEEVENRKRNLNTKKLINDNTIESAKADIIRRLFRHLQAFGVDPSDIDSIGEFIERLNQQDPDLAELFETAFSGLIGSDGAQPPIGGPQLPVEGGPPPTGPQLPVLPDGAPQLPQQPEGPEPNLMNRFGNLASQVPRQ